MFEKSKIAAAMLAAAATSAQAVYVSPDQTGEVLLFPFYNVNNGFQTQLMVANTTKNYKIIKVRLRESEMSQDVLDFNVYLSPHDHWSATIANVDGRAVLSTADTSCTQPALDYVTEVMTDDGKVEGTLATGMPMNTAYSNTSDADARQGYVEVIEMAEIPEGFGWLADNSGFATTGTRSYVVTTGIKHVDGVPADCSVVQRAWTNNNSSSGSVCTDLNCQWGWNGLSADNAFNYDYLRGAGNGGTGTAKLTQPTGGLYGYAIFLELDTGAAYVADAVAINDYSDVPQHYLPSDRYNFLLPSLASGSVRHSVVLGSGNTYEIDNTNTLEAGVATFVGKWPLAWDATFVDGGFASPYNTDAAQTPNSGGNAYPISHVLAAKSIMNDYFVDPTFEGATDWVVTLPMKKHGVPFYKDSSGTAGLPVSIAWYDREEQTPSAGWGVSPVIGSSLVLTTETTVIQWGERSVLGADEDSGALYVMADETEFAEDGYPTGWAALGFEKIRTIGSAKYEGNLLELDTKAEYDAVTYSDSTSSTTGTDVFNGVPVIGFAAIRGNAGTAPGVDFPVGAYFGETIPHKTYVGRDTDKNIGLLDNDLTTGKFGVSSGVKISDCYINSTEQWVDCSTSPSVQ